MSGLKDRIEHLSAISGRSFDPYERSLILSLENVIENQEAEIYAKTQLVQFVNDQKEASQTELEAKKELDDAQQISLKEEIEAIKQKAKILQTYLEVLYTDSFAINKVKSEVASYTEDWYHNLKPFCDRSKKLQEEMKRLKELQNDCNELRLQTNNLMAPSH